jgi:peptidoglycan/LPS O-acetylase OafA/YrhL
MRLGVVAYFMYLVHIQLIEVFRRTLGLWFSPSAVASQFWGGVIGILVTLALANLSWNYFERPLLRRGHAYRY